MTPHPNAQGLPIYLVWGVGEVDRTGVNQLMNNAFLGKARFDPAFALDEDAQRHIYAVCKALGGTGDPREPPPMAPWDELVAVNEETSFGSVKCPVADMKLFIDTCNNETGTATAAQRDRHDGCGEQTSDNEGRAVVLPWVWPVPLARQEAFFTVLSAASTAGGQNFRDKYDIPPRSRLLF